MSCDDGDTLGELDDELPRRSRPDADDLDAAARLRTSDISDESTN